MTVDESVLRLIAEELTRIAQRNERVAADDNTTLTARGSYLRGKAEGLRFAADAITELVEPALKPPLRAVE